MNLEICVKCSLHLNCFFFYPFPGLGFTNIRAHLLPCPPRTCDEIIAQWLRWSEYPVSVPLKQVNIGWHTAGNIWNLFGNQKLTTNKDFFGIWIVPLKVFVFELDICWYVTNWLINIRVIVYWSGYCWIHFYFHIWYRHIIRCIYLVYIIYIIKFTKS